MTGDVLPLTCYGARVLVVDSAGSGVLDRLRPLLPPQAQVSEAPAPDVRYEVRPGAPGDPGGAAAWEVIRDGEVRHRGTTVEALARWLRGDIDHHVATHARDVLFVHAGVVGWRGRAILLPGRSMTGKSTLVAELVRQGARYYSDEYAVIDDRGLVHPYARAPVLRHGSQPVHVAPAPVPDGGAELEPLPAALVVSTAFQDGAPWSPVTVTGARAVLPLIDNTVLAATEPARTVRLAATLAPDVVTLQGRRPDARLVAPEILRFVDELLDGQGAPDGGAALVVSRRWGGGYDAPLRRPAGRAPGPPEARGYPARYLRIERFLDPAEHARLLEYARAHEAEFRPGKVIRAGAEIGVVDPDVRRARDNMALGPVRELFEARLRRLLPEVRRALRVPWFPLAEIETRLVAHADGDFFDLHVDSGRGPGAARRITGVFYFHATPKRFSGGQLRLHDVVLRDGRIEPAPTCTELEPLDNSLVFFPSELYHAVGSVRGETAEFRDSRFTVNIWYRTVLPAGTAADAPDPAPATGEAAPDR